jgi:hypothetical protein
MILMALGNESSIKLNEIMQSSELNMRNNFHNELKKT